MTYLSARVSTTFCTVLLLCSCALESTKPAAAVTDAPTTEAAIPEGSRHFRIIGDETLVTIKAFRGGRLARLGHNHVIAVRALNGDVWLAPEITESRLQLRFRVADLVVDDDALRASAGEGFEATVSEKDKDGTRRNMLSSSLLDGEQFPEIQLASSTITRSPDGLDVNVTVSIKGVSSSIRLPVTLTIDDQTIIAEGNTTISQNALGLVPFSVMLGALKVEDEMQLEYRLIARLLSP